MEKIRRKISIYLKSMPVSSDFNSSGVLSSSGVSRTLLYGSCSEVSCSLIVETAFDNLGEISFELV